MVVTIDDGANVGVKKGVSMVASGYPDAAAAAAANGFVADAAPGLRP